MMSESEWTKILGWLGYRFTGARSTKMSNCAPVDAPQSLRSFAFATKKIRQIFEAPGNFGTGLSVSPGGHWILYIMLVDHFH